MTVPAEHQAFLRLWHPKGWYYAIIRKALRTFGRLSDGIDLGFRSGFNSGLMMEYIYGNKPQGRGAIGKMIDGVYLNAAGWSVTRMAKEHIKSLLAEIVGKRQAQKKDTFIVDLAAGTGRCVLEFLQEKGEKNMEVLLRDLDPFSLELARERTIKLDLHHVRIESADAFAPQSLAGIEPRPDVVLVCGLYENILEDDLVSLHFRAVRSILSDGGTLIFTAQPDHPQFELIARTLVNREGKPWILAKRPLELMRAWAEEGGFTSFTDWHDPWKIYHVIAAA